MHGFQVADMNVLRMISRTNQMEQRENYIINDDRNEMIDVGSVEEAASGSGL